MRKFMYNTKVRKVAMLLTFVCFFLLIILLRSYIITQANHSHDYYKHGCSVCINIENAEYFLSQIGIVLKPALILSLLLFLILTMQSSNLGLFQQDSLVKLKIRMNN